MSLTPLNKLDSADVLDDLKRRVEQMEASEEGGYGACIEFYKRIIDRIERVDELYFALADAEMKKRNL